MVIDVTHDKCSIKAALYQGMQNPQNIITTDPKFAIGVPYKIIDADTIHALFEG